MSRGEKCFTEVEFLFNVIARYGKVTEVACCSVMQCVAVCCSVLQCVVVVCCSVLQCVAVCRGGENALEKFNSFSPSQPVVSRSRK